MRQGQNSKRSRGRSSGRRNVPPRHQTFDSNGPSVRIRGNAYQVHEKYLALARDAGSAGDRIAAENYLQHAEHYFRIINMDNDGDSQGRGRSQQNGAGGRSGRGPDGSNGPDPVSDTRPAAVDGAVSADRPAIAKGAGNGATEEADAAVGGPDGAEAAQAAPKRKVGRGNGKGRRTTRAASRASGSDGGDVAAGSNGAEESDGDTPPAEE